MARKINNLAEVKVYINGKEQAKRDLEELTKQADEFKTKIDETRKSIVDNSAKMTEAEGRANASREGTAEHSAAVKDMLEAQKSIDKAQIELKDLENGRKQLRKVIRETEKFAKDLAEDLDNLSGQNIARLKEMMRQLDAIRNKLDPETDKDGTFLNYLNDAYNRVMDTIKNKKGDLVEFADIMDDLTNIDDTSLAKAEQRLRSLLAATDKDDVERIKQLKDELDTTVGERQRRVKVEAQDVQEQVKDNKWKGTIEETQRAIKLLEDYKKILDTADSDALKEVNSVMDQLKQNIKETESGFLSFEKAMEKAQGIMSETFDPTLDDLEQIQNVLKEGIQNKFHIANPKDEAQLKQTLSLMEEMLKKQKEVMRLNHQDKVDAVSGKLDKVSPAEIEEAVKAAKELQQVAKTKEEFIQLGEFIGKAEARLKDWNETSKQSVMKSQIKDLSAIRALSDGALQDQLKFWEGTMNAAKNTSTAYKEAKKNFEDLQAESKRRLQFEGEKVINDVKLGVGDGSTKQMQERLKLLQDYRAVIDGTKPDAYKAVDEAILKLTEDIKASQAGFLSFDDALKKAQGVMDGSFKPTLEDLEQIQKVLKEGMQSKFNLVDDADIDKLKETRRLMDEMAKKQAEADRIRLKDQATEIMGGDYTKTIEGTKQAIEILKKYQDTLDTTKPDAINEVTKSINKMKEELESASRAKAEEVMANPMNFSADEINEAIKLTEKLQAATNNATVWEDYEQQLIKAREARDRFADDSKYKAMVKQFEDLEDLTANAWAEQKKYWEAMRDSGKYYDEAIAKLKEMSNLEQKLLKDDADKVIGGDYTHTIEGTKQAIELLKKYQSSLNATDTDAINAVTESIKKMSAELDDANRKNAKKVLANPMGFSPAEIDEAIKMAEKMQNEVAGPNAKKQWNDLAVQIDNARKVRDEYVSGGKFEVMNKQFQDFDNLSKSAAAEQKKYWEGLADSMAQTDPRYQTVLDNIKKIKDAEKAQLESKATYIMGGTYDKTIEGTKQAIELLKKYQSTLDATDTDSIEKVNKAIREMNKELDTAANKKARKTLTTNLKTAGTEDIKQSVEWLKKYQGTLKPLTGEWYTINEEIKKGEERLKFLTDKAKMEGMYAQFKRIRDLSKSALAEQKKYWQAVVDGAEKSDPKLKTYEDRLRRIVKEEKERAQDAGRELTKSILSGSWTGTIGESKEAVKVLKEYKDTLNTTDVSSIKRVDKAISELTNKTKIAEAGFKNTSEALSKMWRQTKYLGYGNWKGSIAELEEMRRKLIAIRDTQDKVLSAKDRDRLLQSLKNVDKEIAILKGEAIDINHILLHMKDTPLWKLEKAAEQLKQELRECSENTKDFADKAAQLRRVNKQVETLHKKFKETENVIVRTAKRLMAYVAVYGGFNYAKDKVIEMARANLQLSDTFADVQKTTGLASDEMKELSKSIDSIDTRTSQQQLHELAAVAGQLGLKSQTDILGFVKASNMISVSLNELGSEGTASLMKIATLTGEASQGTEKALLSIGSAINELTANSAATAGPIADLMARMGGVASQAGLTSAQMAAIGATADALGQSMEITGTSMNKFVTTLMSSSDDIAYALNMDAKALRDMLNEGKTMEAMIAVFERMQGMGGMEKLAGVMGELGSEGARMTQVLTALASNVDFLKSQVELSTDAYREATSIQQEYNIKNENALALWQRLGNTLREQVVNSKAVSVLESISRAIFNFVNSILEGGRATRIFTSLVWGLTAALIAQRIAWVKNMNALKFAKGWQALMASIDALTASIHRNIVAMTTSTGRMGLWSRMVTSASMTWKRFMVILRANWLTAIIAGIAALVGWFVKLVTYTSELTRATARYRREVEEEKSQVDALFLSLQRTNKETNNRAKIIEQINRKYGDYLGFMLSEKDSADKLAAAHKLINSELEKRMALNLQSTLQGKAANTYAEKYEEETTDIERSIKGEGLFNSDKFKNLVNPAEVNAFINKLVNDAVSNAIDTSGEFRKMGELDMDEVMANIKKQLQDKFNTDKDKELFRDAYSQQEGLGGMLFGRIKGNIENLLEARVDLMEDTFAAEQAADVEMGRITKSAIKDREAMLEQIEKDYNDLSKINVSTKSESEQKEHYAKMLDNAQDYVDNATKILREIPEAEREITDEQLNANINKYKEQVKRLAPLADVDPWGKSMNLDSWTTFADIIKNIDTASAESLVAAYKKLEEDSKKIPSNVQKFYKMFPDMGLEKLKLQDPADVAKTVHNWEEQIKAKLKDKYGRNTTGGFIFESEGSGGKKTSKQMYDGWLAALEAYYNERATLIRRKGQEQNKLESEVNRELEALNAEKLANQREMEEGLLNDLYKGSTFDPKKFKGVITGTDYFANLTLEHMRSIVSAGGPKLDAEVRKNLTERMVKIEEQAYKIKQRINKILLEDDFTGKVAKQYTESLDQLGLLFNVSTEAQAEHSEEEGERRLAYMRDWAKESYQLNADQLKDKMMQNEMFSSWVIDREHEDYEALLVQLRKFHDDELEAEKRAADRRKRLFDKSGKGMKLQEEAQASEEKASEKVKTEEKEGEMWDRFKGMDLVSDDRLDEQQIEVGNAQIALYQAKIDASNEYIRQIQLEMAVEKEKVQSTIDNIKRELANSNISQERRIQLNADLLAAEQQKNSLIRQEEIITNGVKKDISENEAKQVEVSQEIADRLVAIEQNKISRMKQYTDAIVDFSGQMGEAAFGEVEDRKEAGRQLIKTLLTTLKEHMQIKLTELVMEKMFAQQSTATTAGQVSTEMTLKAAETEADIVAGTASATAKEAGKKGWIGLAVGAAIGAALSALLGLAMGAINKAKSTSDSISGNKKLATGMLTYAEGNYPVLGNDGKVYDAKYEGAGMKTGVYGGGAHFGIFSEKQPEMIVDGKTTQKIILNYPYIYDAITTIAKNGRLKNAMPTFATGDYPAGMKQLAPIAEVDASTGSNEQMERMSAALEQTQAVNNQLLKLLQNGITAHLDGLETHKQQKKNERFLKRRGID